MAINDPEFDQRLKEQMNAIELGDDLILDDPEEYEDEGGLRSLKNKKMASETPEEEFELELGAMFEEFQEAVKNGYEGTIEDFSRYYFSKKEKEEAPSIKLASGGRINYNQGSPKQITEPPSNDLNSLARSMKMDTTTGEGANIFKLSDLMKERERGLLNKKQMDMQKIINDQKAKDRASKMDMRERDLKISDIERIKEMIQKAKEDKLKRAKGGIAGVL